LPKTKSTVQAIQSKLPAISTVLVGIVLCAVPFASRFTPDPIDPGLRHIQTLCVVAGLFVALLSIAPVHLSILGSRSWHRTAMLYSACLVCFAIGWRCIPYWATGVYARDIGLYPPADMDPKRLVPMIWIGEIWRIGVLGMALITGISAPILVAVAAHSAFRRLWLDAGLTLLFAVLAVGFLFWFQRDFTGWLLD
jgi:hypothetical protein